MTPAETLSPPDEAARRQRAKERLYVICQAGGWSFFLITQLVFVQIFSKGQDTDPAVFFQTVFIGLLITHFSRRLIDRWRWKELSWLKLAWRIPAMGLGQSVVWSAVGYGLHYGLLRNPWPPGVSPAAIVSVSLLNGTLMLSGWLCLYFFFHLFDRFSRLEIERLRLESTLKEAELRALKSQVNPHFMFNALNSLRALIDEDPARARQAVTQLANLLRYSLKTGQLEAVPFEDELSVVNDYLALEQVRLEERLRLRVEVEPGALRLPLPPMLLQTLVENAVKYGVASRAEGGEIRIEAGPRDGGLALRVSNPGLLDPGGVAPAASTGVGLRNAADRLRLLCGDRAALAVRQAGPGVVVAEAFVPEWSGREGNRRGEDS